MLDVRRRACLQAMGIDLWRRNDRAVTSLPAPPGGIESAADQAPQAAPYGGDLASSRASIEAVHGRWPSQDRAPGEAAWQDDLPDVVITPELPPAPPALETVAILGWDELRAKVADCKACALHEQRTQTVFGVGDRRARLMVIGEAPGADEDRQGEPFVGRAGQLLDAMLLAIGFERSQVYIANIVKCRPPGNRDPHAEEAAACRDYLARQIELVGPELILSVGRVSAHNLLGTDEAVGRLRGTVHRLDPGNVPLIVTYHPAYLLRRPQEKAKSWQDLQAAWRLLNQA